jgi:polysaccharide biosynthesis protein PslG
MMVSFGLLACIFLLLPGAVRTPLRASAASGRPVSYVLSRTNGVRLQGFIASPAKPVGYDTQILHQSDPARYAGLVESGAATSLRDDVTWTSIEPVRGKFNWSGPDEIVAEAALRHLHPLLIVDTSPLWASGGSRSNNDWFWLPPRSPAAYGAFAAAVAARYGPGGAFWKKNPKLPRYLPAGIELWNEENLSPSWGGLPPNPKLYTAMVKAAYPLIKRADPSMTVVTGGLAPAGAYSNVTCGTSSGSGHDAHGWNGLNYLQALYADGIKGHFDAVGWHPYSWYRGATAADMLAYDPCSAWSQMASTPVSVRSLMTAHGDAAKRIWATEAGAPTCIAHAAYGCVAVAQQADLAAAEAREWKTFSWGGGFYWYDIRDSNTTSQDIEAHFGTMTSDDSPKPAYQVLKQAWSAAPAQKNPQTLPVPGSRGVRSVAFSPDGKYLAAGDANGHVYVWQLSPLHLVSTMTDPASKGVTSVAFNPSGSLIAAGDANGHVYLWTAGKAPAALAAPSGADVRSAAFSSDGKYVAAGDSHGNVYVWQLTNLGLASTMTDPGSKGVTSVAFNPANTLLAAGDANGKTYLWAHQLAGTLTRPSSRGVTSVAFSGNNLYLADGDASGKACIWLLSKHTILQTLANPDRHGIESVAFSPSSTVLATADALGHIYLWSPGPKLIATLTDPSSRGIPSVTFSSNGRYAATADANGHVYLWVITASDASQA